MASVTGKAKEKHEDWDSITIRKSGNGGFIVSKSLPPKDTKNGMSWSPDPPPLVFESAEAADEYVDGCMGIKDGPAAAEKGKA